MPSSHHLVKSKSVSPLLCQCLDGAFWKLDLAGYCPQQPWILNDTVRNNITFGEPFDATRYAAVTHACALDHDIGNLAGGHDTEIVSWFLWVYFLLLMTKQGSFRSWSSLVAHKGCSLLSTQSEGLPRSMTRVAEFNQSLELTSTDFESSPQASHKRARRNRS